MPLTDEAVAEIVAAWEDAFEEGSLNFRDDALADPVLAADSARARSLAAPGTATFADEIAFEAECEFEACGGDGHTTMTSWATALFAAASEWNHFGGGVAGDLRWSCWGNIQLDHSGLLLVTDDSTGASVVRVVDTN